MPAYKITGEIKTQKQLDKFIQLYEDENGTEVRHGFTHGDVRQAKILLQHPSGQPAAVPLWTWLENTEHRRLVKKGFKFPFDSKLAPKPNTVYEPSKGTMEDFKKQADEAVKEIKSPKGK